MPWSLLLCGGLLLALVCSGGPAPGRRPFWRFFTGTWLALFLTVFGVLFWQQSHDAKILKIEKSRNFYGVLTVTSVGRNQPDWHYNLSHGSTLHGQQFADPFRAAWPTTYYSEKSGVGLALQALPAGSRRIGVVGLGAGTLAAYARAGDYFRFYEINPAVVRLAGARFTFIANARGTVEIILGDARLALEREPPQGFDLLVLDAFNSDAIPMHLLTREAFAIYERHLSPGGIIAVHISNRSLNLEPVVLNAARQFNYQAIAIDNSATPEQWWVMDSEWMLLSRNREILQAPAISLAARPLQTQPTSLPPWTDDFASLFPILRVQARPEINPAYGNEQSQIAIRLCQQGKIKEAIKGYRQAIRLHPRMPELLNNLAWLLATGPNPDCRNGPQAVQFAERACQLTRYRAITIIGTLAAAYAEAGRFDEAMATAQRACTLAARNGETDLLQKNQQLLERYRRLEPARE